MKKLLFGLIATVVFGFVGNAKDLCDLEHNNPDKLKVNIDITWGRKSLGCVRFGICDVDVNLEIDTKTGLAGGADDYGTFTVSIDAAAATSIKTYFGGEAIVIDENFTLSPDACKTLGLKTGYTIRTGVYKLAPSSSIKGAYTVSF